MLAKRTYKAGMTLTDAQKARIEANKLAAAHRRQTLYEARRLDTGIRLGGWQRNSPTAMIKEKKVVDINVASYNFRPSTTPPVPQLLNGCVAGSQNFNRIGRKIEMKSIQIHGYWIVTGKL